MMGDCKLSSRQVAGPAGRQGRARAWLGAVVAAAALLAGCATPVTSDLTVFHEWPEQAPRTYRLVTNEAQLDSLEHANYRQVMRNELARIGFSEAGQAARFELRFDTAIEARRDRRVEYTQPYIHPWFWWGSWGRHGGVSIGMPFPMAGHPVEREIAWYEYQLTVSFRDLSDGRKVYEATAVATGGAASIAGAMPYLARAVFADFPGLSGVTRRVEVPREAVAAETPEREQAAQPAR